METGNKRIYTWPRCVVLLLLAGAALSLVACGTQTIGAGGAEPAAPQPAPGVVSVDVIALNHPPLQPVLTELDQILAPYGDRIHVTHYDFDTPDGANFASKMGLSGHIPLVIFIDGKDTFTLDGRKVTFESFPQGEGTGIVADGAWTMADVDAVLKKTTGQ
jgi:hypothetical protein